MILKVYMTENKVTDENPAYEADYAEANFVSRAADRNSQYSNS